MRLLLDPPFAVGQTTEERLETIILWLAAMLSTASPACNVTIASGPLRCRILSPRTGCMSAAQIMNGHRRHYTLADFRNCPLRMFSPVCIL